MIKYFLIEVPHQTNKSESLGLEFKRQRFKLSSHVIIVCKQYAEISSKEAVVPTGICFFIPSLTFHGPGKLPLNNVHLLKSAPHTVGLKNLQFRSLESSGMQLALIPQESASICLGVYQLHQLFSSFLKAFGSWFTLPSVL